MQYKLFLSIWLILCYRQDLLSMLCHHFLCSSQWANRKNPCFYKMKKLVVCYSASVLHKRILMVFTITVHAVVLLYNYYHRKQSPQLEFLGFESFCRFAVVMKPALLAHMKLLQRSGVAEVNDLETELSVLEKMVMDACNISESLDAAKSFPTIEGWPISKVAVLLVDSQKSNCLLKHDHITQGIWSLLENDFESSKQMPVTMIGYKRKRIPKNSVRDGSSADEVVLRQLAFSAVKREIEISDADLNVLESHVVYSHSKEKAAARFYIIQCMQSACDGLIQVPIKEAIESLQGPLLKMTSHRWVVSPVVEYLHLLPYAGIISDWFSRIACV